MATIELSNGVVLSEETIIEACKAQGIKINYQFQAGDVVDTPHGGKRIIITGTDDKLYAVNEYGRVLNLIKSQEDCERYEYKKIGKLNNFLAQK